MKTEWHSKRFTDNSLVERREEKGKQVVDTDKSRKRDEDRELK